MTVAMTYPTIAVDFDGVIHKYSKGWLDGTIYDEPMEGVHEGLFQLLRFPYHVYIHTTRNVQDVVKWMNTKFWGEGETGFQVVAVPEGITFWHGGRYEVGVSNRKLPAYYYIDDRAVLFTNWKEVLEKVKMDKEEAII